MSSHSLVKLYVSRGVQTEDVILVQCPRCDSPHRMSSVCTTTGDFATPSVGLSSETLRGQILGALAYEDAYTRTQTAEYSELLPLISSHGHQKYVGLSSSRPSNAHVFSKRVVSLPDPSVQEAVMTERNLRIVSMPESTRFSALNFCNTLGSSQTNSSFSSDASHHHSVEHSGLLWPSSHNKSCPSDIPQTPSPPSSPDSVVIIGNEPHVSGSFLRRPSTDDDGWITWASSPPRPIPALHGPLSLPYARCPSGAEGTVTEGDDLSHKIWGLGTFDTQNSAHPSKNGIQPQPQSASVNTNEPCQDARMASFQHQRLGDEVIDLSMPSTFYSASRASSISERNLNTIHGAQHNFTWANVAANSFPDEFKTSYGVVHSQHIRNPVDRPSAVLGNFRTGLDTSTSMSYRNPGHLDGPAQMRLNKAAPIFIPSIDWNLQSTHIQRNDVDASALDHQYSRQAELRQQRHSELISPPSTSSPRWSPVFPQPIDNELPKGLCHDPKIYSPRPDLDDYSKKLMLMIQQIKNQDLINSTKRYSTDATKQAREPLVQKPTLMNGANQYREEECRPHSGKINASSVYTNVRRDLSQQHPRSIPLARLIQRRLSSVAEEDDHYVSNSASSLLQNAHPRMSLEPLIYRSSTDQIATDATASTVSLPPIAETINNQKGNSNSNAIVKLPRKCAPYHASRTSNVHSKKNQPHNDTKKDRTGTVHAQEDS